MPARDTDLVACSRKRSLSELNVRCFASTVAEGESFDAARRVAQLYAAFAWGLR